MAKATKQPKRFHLPQKSPNRGPGLSPDNEPDESFRRAQDVIAAWREREATSTDAIADVNQQLMTCCGYYWPDKLHDERPNLAANRKEIQLLSKSLVKVSFSLNKISYEAKDRICVELKWLQSERPDRFIYRFKRDLDLMMQACEKVSTAEGAKTSDESVLNCCTALVRIREKITGRSFKRNTKPKFEAGIASTTRFASADSQFVLEVAKAIDEKVKFSRVQTDLDAIMRVRRREEKGA